jgi:hypothetical protein
MKPYPYKGKKDDPAVFTFSQKSIDKYKPSNYLDGDILWTESITNKENQISGDTSYDTPFSHTQKETKKKQSRLLGFLFGCIGRK